MAKELAMIENNEKGKTIRKYFIECENMWNSPEMILMKANQIQGRMIENYKKEIQDIRIELAYQKEIVAGVTENIDVYQKQKILILFRALICLLISCPQYFAYFYNGNFVANIRYFYDKNKRM